MNEHGGGMADAKLWGHAGSETEPCCKTSQVNTREARAVQKLDENINQCPTDVVLTNIKHMQAAGSSPAHARNYLF